ncbi:MAG: hypothetical protein OXF63_03775 [Anaerolineaceae bacterium]|nr:hypothetical protein [Anaerolineaceae bacterium]
MIDIIHHPADSGWARQVKQDLASVDSGATLVLLSTDAVDDPQVLEKLEHAFDGGRRIVPLLPEGVSLPALVEHLEPVEPGDLEDLVRRLSDAEASLPMRVHTRSLRASNRRAALVVLLLAGIMFVAALYGVGVLGIQYPHEEYDEVNERVVATRDAYIEQALPRGTSEAELFAVTAEAAATALRPLLIATATARAGN